MLWLFVQVLASPIILLPYQASHPDSFNAFCWFILSCNEAFTLQQLLKYLISETP